MNFRHTVTLLAGCVAASMGSTAYAADARGNFAIYGIGGQSCGVFKQDAFVKNQAVQTEMVNWLLGYLSAGNRSQAQTFDQSPIQSPAALAQLVASVCAQNPNSTVEGVFSTVLNRFASLRSTQSSATVTMQSGQNTAVIRADTLTKVQTALTRLGYYKGAADGKFSPAVSAALRAYQKKMGIPETGIADANVLLKISG